MAGPNDPLDVEVKQHRAELGELRKKIAGLSDPSERLDALEAIVNAILTSLNAATISAECNPDDSTITVTLTFPDLPPPPDDGGDDDDD